MPTKPLPTPKQVCDYLWAHGWRERAVFRTGWMYEFERLSDDGQPLEVFVAGQADYDDYGLRISDVIDSLSGLERRSKDAVRADLLAMNTAPAASPNGTAAEDVPDAATQPQA